MVNFNTIINKIEGYCYNSIDEVINDLDISDFIKKCFFNEMKDSYDDLTISLNFMNDEFIKSFITCLRILNYINVSNKDVGIAFRKDIETSLPSISVLTSTNNGTLTMASVPNKNIVQYAYAKRQNLGIISSEGHVKLTMHESNTKDALDLIFKMVEK